MGFSEKAKNYHFNNDSLNGLPKNTMVYSLLRIQNNIPNCLHPFRMIIKAGH